MRSRWPWPRRRQVQRRPALAGPAAGCAGRPPGGNRGGLARLRADANGRLRVHRAADGAVDFVSSTDGRAMLDAQGTDSPRRTVADQLHRYGRAFGIDGSLSRAVVTQTTAVHDRWLGGPLRAGGRRRPGLRRPGRDEPRRGPGRRVGGRRDHRGHPGPGRARQRGPGRQVALAVTAKSRHLPARLPEGHRPGSQALRPRDRAHLRPPRRPSGVGGRGHQRPGRPRDRADRHRTRRGRAALQRTARLNRTICDNKGAETLASWREIPVCAVSKQARNETSGVSAVSDVNQAFENLGATSAAYSALDGIDLTNLLGSPSPGRRASSPPCAGATATRTSAPWPTRSGTAARWSSARATRRRTTSSDTSSPTATSRTPPTCSTSTRAAR